MKIELFRIGNIPIYGYGAMIALGILLAMVVGTIRFKKRGLKEDAVFDIVLVGGICGFMGAKLLYVIVEFQEFLKDPLGVLGSTGFVVYGGLIAGVIAGWVYTRIKKINFMEYWDNVMPEIAMIQGFGRIGCFLAGCCYGKETTAWYGVVFPDDCLAPPDGVSRIPTQLISAAGDWIIAIGLMILLDIVFKNVKKQQSKKFGHVYGDIGCAWLILYGVGRFAVEFLRADYRGTVGIFSTSQFISIFMVAIGVGILVFNRVRLGKIETKQVDKDKSEDAEDTE